MSSAQPFRLGANNSDPTGVVKVVLNRPVERTYSRTSSVEHYPSRAVVLTGSLPIGDYYLAFANRQRRAARQPKRHTAHSANCSSSALLAVQYGTRAPGRCDCAPAVVGRDLLRNDRQPYRRACMADPHLQLQPVSCRALVCGSSRLVVLWTVAARRVLPSPEMAGSSWYRYLLRSFCWHFLLIAK
jgi:hypothetical protein